MAAAVDVESVRRKITLSIDAAEADLLRQHIKAAGEPPYSGKLLYGALSAIVDNREYGGH